MKRTIFLLMSILLLLTACGDGHKQTSSDKEQSEHKDNHNNCLLYTSPSPRDQRGSRMPSSA